MRTLRVRPGLKAARCPRLTPAGTLIRLHWTSFSVELKSSICRLSVANDEFEREVQLANVQEQTNRHGEVMALLRPSGLTTNINLPRNPKFTGRDDVLASLHSLLAPSFTGAPAERVACSCTIHAIGGMGKTETALEYTYRFQKHYDYIFWLRAQTEQLLWDSVVEVVSILGLVSDESVVPSKKLQIYIRWLQTTGRFREKNPVMPPGCKPQC